RCTRLNAFFQAAATTSSPSSTWRRRLHAPTSSTATFIVAPDWIGARGDLSRPSPSHDRIRTRLRGLPGGATFPRIAQRSSAAARRERGERALPVVWARRATRYGRVAHILRRPARSRAREAGSRRLPASGWSYLPGVSCSLWG